MIPTKRSLEVYRGDTRRWQVKLWADAERAQPIDLNGVTAAAQIQMSSPVVTLGCTVTLPNVIDLLLTAQDSKTLAIGKGLWDLQLTYPGGDIVTVLAGEVHVVADVTIVGGV
jgi:hypothetical protein